MFETVFLSYTACQLSCATNARFTHEKAPLVRGLCYLRVKVSVCMDRPVRLASVQPCRVRRSTVAACWLASRVLNRRRSLPNEDSRVRVHHTVAVHACITHMLARGHALEHTVIRGVVM